jgi:hypothetical protein
MDEESRLIHVDGSLAGNIFGVTVNLVYKYRTAAELRAIADFLDQLAGADLLSSVVEG